MSKLIETIQENFSNEFSASLSVERIVTAVLLTFVLSLAMVFVYRLTYSGVSFNKGFAAGLILLSLITSTIIMTISTNLVLSLGMVGALSIVRFRTAVKEPNDTIFMFWAISIGLMCGAGLVFISILSTVAISVLYMLVHFIYCRTGSSTYLLVLRYEAATKEAVEACINTFPKFKIRSKTAVDDCVELAIELKLSKNDFNSIERLREIDGVRNVSAVAFNATTLL